MLEVQSQYDGLNITGFISPISLTRSNRREITFFVNGRPVQDTTLNAALVQAYQNMLMVGRFPMAVLFLEVSAEMVDVNVHPAKAEVRFRERERIFSGVQRAVRTALLAYSPIPQIQQAGSWQFRAPSEDEQADLDWKIATDLENQETKGSQESPPPALPVSGVPLLRLIGQIASSYLVAEGPDGLYLIDQHAAHERVLFEKFTVGQEGPISAQVLLQPVSVDLSPAASRLLNEQLPVLNKFGFQVEAFGPSTFLVRAIPSILSGSDPAAALHVLVEDFEEDERPLQTELEAKMIARICKRAAVKAGHMLSLEEQRALLADLENCQSPRTCPHGRPTMIHLSVDLLERQFGRRGAR
jgi:DNA mismatch repair protein MutL